jgi:alginate O-acetyltransferase complex protein AlgI
MIFNSLAFIFFFVIVVTAYFALPYRWRWLLLLVASFYFYMCWNPRYVVLLVASILIDYLAALGMGERVPRPLRVALLAISMASNLGILFSFKYYNFFCSSAEEILGYFNIFYHAPEMKLLLPVGISFYSFQSMSYTIDVYRRQMPIERNLLTFSLFVTFFPQLVAGPIERATNLLPQLRDRKNDFNYQRIVDGLKIMGWGIFKKVAIADQVSDYVKEVYGSPHAYSGLWFWVATYFFAIQIYCDFSGYSDIAIGAAKTMGYDLMTNFNRPYFSKSIPEFWRRWHISLSTWFRDYVYFPLGGNRVSRRRTLINQLTVFLLSGLWHGANWTFIIWGAIHGFMNAFTRSVSPYTDRFLNTARLTSGMQKYVKIFVTFHIVCFSWIFFRAANVGDAFYIIRHLFDFSPVPGTIHKFPIFPPLSIGLIVYLFLVEMLQRREPVIEKVKRYPAAMRWAYYFAFIGAILILGVFEGNEFIYFQF